MKNVIVMLIIGVLSSQASVTKRRSDREHDGFVGPTRTVFVYWTPISGWAYPAESKCRQLTNEYDQSGRITRHSVYPGECGSDEIREDYSYSPDGNKSTSRRAIRAGNTPSPPPAVSPSNAERENGPGVQVLKYDDFGRLIEESSVQANGRFSYKTNYTYDAKGRLTETTGYGNSQVTSRRVFTYTGEERVPAELTYYGRNGKIYERTTYTDYEFNSKGDWLKRKETTEETFNRRHVSMSYREIEYYPDTK